MSTKVSILFIICILYHLFVNGSCTEFEVGATNANLTRGWEVPLPNHPQVYNDWAQKNRFKVNDSLHFKYRKDSVMVVTDPEYDKCRTSQPIYFANNGDTTYVLDRPGLFFFISGVAGHCEHGQKMVVKVLDLQNETAAPVTTNKNDATHFKFIRFWSFMAFFILGLFIIGY